MASGGLISCLITGCSDDETEVPPTEECARTTQLSVGEGHACLLGADGAVRCFGANEYGQLGLGHTSPTDPTVDGYQAVDLGAGRAATQIAVGPQFSCALLDDATVKCWGTNGSGQLGQGDTLARGDDPGELGDALGPVRMLTGEPVLARFIAAGQGTACAIRLDDRIICWGNNSYGQLGPGRTEIDVPIPDSTIDVGTGAIPSSMQIGGPGGAHVCTIIGGARQGLKCWGYNGVGALGLGNNLPLSPDQLGDMMPWVDLGSGFGLPDASSVAEVALGHRSSCARSSSGIVKCWGYGFYGLGSGNQDLGNEPMEMGDALPDVPLPGFASTLFAGGYHFCATMDDGAVICWGRNDQGQLGLDATDNGGDEPAEPLAPTSFGGEAIAGAGDELASCVVGAGACGEVWCWGGGLGKGLGDAAGEMQSLTSYPAPKRTTN
jgi:E3 ubiquitin-protein ligase HERC3